MKCVKSTKSTKQIKLGEIIRTTDEDAMEKVRGGNWIYVQKSEWKDGKVSDSKNSEVKSNDTDETKTKKGKSKKELKQEKKRNK